MLGNVELRPNKAQNGDITDFIGSYKKLILESLGMVVECYGKHDLSSTQYNEWINKFKGSSYDVRIENAGNHRESPRTTSCKQFQMKIMVNRCNNSQNNWILTS